MILRTGLVNWRDLFSHIIGWVALLLGLYVAQCIGITAHADMGADDSSPVAPVAPRVPFSP